MGLFCKLCGNGEGEKAVSFKSGQVLITVYVCNQCVGDKPDYEIFKLTMKKGGYARV